MKRILVLSAFLWLASTGCTKKASGPTVWIYTSIYKNVISEMEPLLAAEFPGVQFQFYQSGSENVHSRLNAELASGKTQADILLTSDPFAYLELANAGHLLAYTSPAAEKISPLLKDPKGFFTTVRICVGVIAYNTTIYTPATAPQSWSDLGSAPFKGKLSMPNPLESGTALMVTSQLVKAKGWELFDKLSANGTLAAGGNSAVIQRMETKERPVGIVLLENVLEAQKKQSPLGFVYPKEGVALVPSPIAILSKTTQPELAKKVYDFFLSEKMQKAVIAGRMHSPVLTAEGPGTTRTLTDLMKVSLPWSPQFLVDSYQEKESIKERFAKALLH